MLESPHVIVGAAIATRVGNPFLALPLAFGSHFVLDMLPHWNPHINTEIKKYGSPSLTSTSIIIADSLFALVAGSYLSIKAFFVNPILGITIFLACFMAVLPDVVEIPYYFLRKESLWAQKWIKWQKKIQNDVPVIPGVLTQIFVIVASLIWLT